MDSIENKKTFLSRQTILIVISQVFLIGVLYLFPPIEMGVISFFIIVIILTVLIYNFKSPVSLFLRSAAVDYSLNQDSGLRRYTNPNIFSKIVHYVLSFIGALVLLVYIDNLESRDWLLLIASVISFQWIFYFLNKKISHNFNNKPKLVLTLKISSYINFLVIVAAIVFFELSSDYQVLIGKGFVESVMQAWNSKVQDVNNPLAYLLAIDDVMYTSQFWFMQNYLISENTSSIIKALGWMVFLILNAIPVALIWTAFLGIHYSIYNQEKQDWKVFGKSQFSAIFWITFILLSLLFWLLKDGLNVEKTSYQTVTIQLPAYTPKTRDYYESNADICTDERVKQDLESINNIVVLIGGDITKNHIERYNKKVEKIIYDAFSPVDSGIDKFLDWNYSLKTEYVMLYKIAYSKISGEEELRKYINLHSEMFILDPLEKSLSDHLIKIEPYKQQVLDEMKLKIQEDVAQKIANFDTSCLKNRLQNIQEAIDVHADSIGVGNAAGGSASLLTAKLISKKVTNTIVSKVVVKIAAKVGLKLASSSTAAASSVFCGPAAPFCAIGAAAAVWVGVDALVVEGDEALSRDDLKQELLDGFDQARTEVMDEYKMTIENDINSIHDNFNIIRDTKF